MVAEDEETTSNSSDKGRLYIPIFMDAWMTTSTRGAGKAGGAQLLILAILVVLLNIWGLVSRRDG